MRPSQHKQLSKQTVAAAVQVLRKLLGGGGKGGSVEPLFLGQDRQEIDAKREAYHEASGKFRRAEQNDVAAGEIEKGLDHRRMSRWLRRNCGWHGVVPASGRTIAKVMCDGQGLRHRAASQSRASPVWT
jgi:hypothetical protein